MDAREATPFGNLLRRHRMTAGLTREALAERAGLSVRGIADLESGARRAPYRDTVQRLSAALALDAAGRRSLEAAARPPRMTPAMRGALDGAAGSTVVPSPAFVVPQPPTPLVGREADVAEARARLLHGDVRLLTLTGTGGVGKTRLAIELAARLRQEFPDGVTFVALEALRDSALVLPAIARALGVRQHRAVPLAGVVGAFLAERRVLLVLDNFEQLLPAAIVVSDLLAACARLRVIATSREPLRLRAEYVVPLLPLDLPDPAHVADPARLVRSPAVALFVARAHAAAGGFALTMTNAVAVAELCRRLDGLPLAIELAAAGVRAASPQDILDRLRLHAGTLGDGFQDLPVRQQGLRATLEWSHNLLQEPERAVLRRLSVFAGGCDIEAAEAVCTDGQRVAGNGQREIIRVLPVPTEPTFDLLTSLVEKSLLVAEYRGETARYRLLETVREYAHERLAASAETDAVRHRHLGWALALAELAAPHLIGAGQEIWLQRLEAEHDNLRAALQWSLDCDRALLGLQLAGALWRFWQARGHLSEGRAWLDRLVARTDAAPDSIRAAALLGAASIAHDQGDYAGAVPYAEQSLALAGEMDERGVAEARMLLGMLAYRRSDYAAATAHGEQSLVLGRTLDDQRLAGRCHNLLGLVALDEGRYETAAERFEAALASLRAAGDVRQSAMMLNNLGLTAQRMEDFASARAYLEESLALNRRLGNSPELARNLITLALITRSMDDPAAAEGLAAEALTLSREMGNRNGIAEALSQLSGIARQRGALDAAHTYSAMHLREARAIGYGVQMLAAVTEAAANAHAAGRAERAIRLLAAAEAGREALGLAQHARMRRSVEEHLRALHDQVDEPSFAAAWAAGTTMSLDEAIADALTGSVEPDIPAVPDDCAPSRPS